MVVAARDSSEFIEAPGHNCVRTATRSRQSATGLLCHIAAPGGRPQGPSAGEGKRPLPKLVWNGRTRQMAFESCAQRENMSTDNRQPMKPEGWTADEIATNEVRDHSSWHFFQAVSWLDFAKRTRRPAALHYAALDLRYGLEYLLFELLVLRSRGLKEEEYRKCLGNPKAMKKALSPSKLNYDKLVEFTRILMALDSRAPKLRYWKLDELFKYWGIASEFLHFVGAHQRTYTNGIWFSKSLARLEGVLTPIWNASTTTLGFGLLSTESMEPEVHQAWLEFSAGRLKEEGLKIRMRIIQPALEARRRRRNRLIL